MPSSKKTPSFITESRQVLTGSEKARANVPAAKPATGKVTVSVIVRGKSQIAPRSLGKTRINRAEYAKSYAADPADLKQVRAFAKAFGLTVNKTPAEAARRTLQLTGSAAAMQKAFGVQLNTAAVAGVTCRIREGGIQIPSSLSGIIVAVLGLDSRPQAKPHFRVFNPPATIRPNASATNTSYTPVQVGQLYKFPSGKTATGQTIGLIELGGGYRAADIKAYFKSLRISPSLLGKIVGMILVEPGRHDFGLNFKTS